MLITPAENAGSGDPQALLEQVYLEEYLQSCGYRLADLKHLPEEEARQLMVRASTYASGKLSEGETRAQYVHAIHGTAAHVHHSKPR